MVQEECHQRFQVKENLIVFSITTLTILITIIIIKTIIANAALVFEVELLDIENK